MGVYSKFCDMFMGECIHSIDCNVPTIFLSFDDGPFEGCTDKVLDLLEKHDAKVTFFVVAQRAKQNKHLIDRMINEGHAIGNHSLDHSYSKFFGF